jgi:hypothetical protein
MESGRNENALDYLRAFACFMAARLSNFVHAGRLYPHSVDRRRRCALHPTDKWTPRGLKHYSRQSQWQRYHYPNQAQCAFYRDPDNAKRQEQQPHNWVKEQRCQREGPAQH